MSSGTFDSHQVVSHDEWLAARAALLAREKAFTRQRDALTLERQNLPWEPVTKEYVFEGPRGRETLADLFDGRSQLIVYHFMFEPAAKAGCPHCSRWADGFNGAIVHINQRDVTMVVVSRAPYEKLEAYKKRMGWTFTWLSSHDSDFNYDFQASFTLDELARKEATYNFVTQDPGTTSREGLSVFARDGQHRVFHTYSTYARGIEAFSIDYQLLDLVPKGRDEGGRGPYWVKRKDEYGT